ncbi:tripartite tricarboxylate transporter permease [Falsigemmobacter intermedius]|uniref:tripartite tricarboxylate transporter permease n=1 Tax=Falsigemmobacter intermedius TaxID=1553448 RepID=UPI003F087D06
MVEFAHILSGFERAFAFDALLMCFVGVTIGTFIGVLPGVGALTAVALCLPLTFYMDPTVGLIMLAGIFYGAQYGSSTASILLNVPGSVTSAVTCLDGYPMAKQGRAGVALFMTTICSFVGGSIAILIMMVATPLVAAVALKMSSVEYFMIMAMGLVMAATVAPGSPIKSLAMVAFGLALGTVGMDLNSGALRYTFGQLELTEGISLVAIAMGMFGLTEIIGSIGKSDNKPMSAREITFRRMMPTRKDVKDSVMPTLRGTGIGAVIGALPGAGATIATFMAYATEKKVSKDPSRFGKGAIEGVVAPEAANNSAVQAAFMPTLSLGIPGDALMAFLLGAMIMHGIVPGPRFLTEQPVMFWGLIASFWIGNVFLLFLNIPLIGLWVRLLTVPYRILYPLILFFICMGVFAIKQQVFDIWLVVGFGALGLVLLRFGYPPAPILLGFVLGPLMEEHFSRAMLMSRGKLSIFLERPISAVLLIITAVIFFMSLRSVLRLMRAGTHTAAEASLDP